MRRSLILLAIIIGACGTDEEASVPSTTRPPGPARRLLQIADEGGFAPVEFSLTALPRYVLYDDGTMYLQGPQIMIYPGPLLPNIQTVLVDPDGLDQVLAIVERMGLPGITAEYNTDAANRVADAPATIATYYDASGSHLFSVYALGIVDIADPRVDQMRNLIALLDDLSRRATGLGQYTSDRLQVSFTQGATTDELSQTRSWPLAAAPDRYGLLVDVFRCAVLEGSEAAAALDILANANQLTLWDYQGTTYTLFPRPLLPGEEGCVRPA